MKETKNTIPQQLGGSLQLHLRDKILLCAGLLTILLIPVLILLQTYAESWLYSVFVPPKAPFYPPFYLRSRLDTDVRKALEGERDALLRDFQEGMIDRSYWEAISVKPEEASCRTENEAERRNDP